MTPNTSRPAGSGSKPVPDNSLGYVAAPIRTAEASRSANLDLYRFSMDNGDLGLREPTSNEVPDFQLAPALDPTAFSAMTSASQPGAYSTANPGGLVSSFPNPPSDLFHSVDSGTMTPVSLSYPFMGSSAPVAPNNPVFNDFNQFIPQQYLLSNPYQQPTFAPNSLSQGYSHNPVVDDPGGPEAKAMNIQDDSWSLDGMGNSPDQMNNTKTDTR